MTVIARDAMKFDLDCHSHGRDTDFPSVADPRFASIPEVVDSPASFLCLQIRLRPSCCAAGCYLARVVVVERGMM